MPFSPLSPIVTLLGGALLLFLLRKRLPPSHLSLLAFLSLGVAFSLLLALRLGSPIIVLIPWPSVKEGSRLAFRAEGIGFLYAFLLSFPALIYAGVRLSLPVKEGWGPLAGGLVLVGGGLGFLFSHNPLALYLSWGFLDLSIILTMGLSLTSGSLSSTMARVAVLNFLAGWALFFSLLSGLGYSPFLLLLATWIRLAIYPASLAYLVAEELPSLAGGVFSLAALAAGGYLLSLYPWPPLMGPSRVVLLLLAGGALVYGSILLWRGKQRASLYVAQSQLGLLALGLLAGGEKGWRAVPLQIVSLVVALGVLRVGRELLPFLSSSRSLLAKIPLGVAVASLVGFPLTAGFAARWLIYGSLLEEGQGFMVALGTLSGAAMLAPLLDLLTGKPESSLPKSKEVVLVVALWLLATPLVALGLYPPLGQAVAGVGDLPGSFPLLGELLATESSLPSLLWTATVAPLVMGWLLFRWKGWVSLRMEALWGGVSFLEPERFYLLLEEGRARFGGGLGRLLEAMGGEHSLGWLLLFAILAGLFLLGG